MPLVTEDPCHERVPPRDIVSANGVTWCDARTPEPVLRHRRPQQIAAQLFQARAICGRHLDVGVQIEPREVRVPRSLAESLGLPIDYAPAATHDQPRLFTVIYIRPTPGQGR